MIEVIDTNLPSRFNQKIINLLFTSRLWGIATDKKPLDNNIYDINKYDTGFTLASYEKQCNNFGQNNLNIYAEIIADSLFDKTKIKNIKNIERFYWNWYNQTSITEFHQDREENNKISIVYNIHNNDGGTEIKIDNDLKFFPSISGQAIIFDSNLWHRGLPPKINTQRFSLNILLET
jgi:hypothetical protein